MGTVIRTQIIKIGNSRGIRIPKLLLEQSGIQTDVEIEVEGDRLIVRPVAKRRAGWNEAFAAMAEREDDQPLDLETSTSWDKTEWKW
jgi:antitoxin MazE